MTMRAYADMSRDELLDELRRVTNGLHQGAATHEARMQLRTQEGQLREVREELEAQRDRYTELFDFAPAPYVVSNGHGVIRTLNLSAARLLRAERHHLAGMLLLNRVAPEYRQAFLDHLLRCRQSHDVVTTELGLEALDGSRLLAQLSTKRGPSGYDDEEWYLSSILDLTERQQQEAERLAATRAREKARAENRAKDRFIAVLSHELRNPLTPVLLMVQAIERGIVRDEQLTSAMSIIRCNVEQEVRLIDDLLDVTRITHGKVGLRREALDLHEVVEEAVAGRFADMQRAGLTATLDLAAARHIVVGDAVRLRQVVWNLLNNAMRYTESGGRVVVRTDNPSPDAIQLTVEDTGQGLDPSVLDRIFAPFDQASADHEHRGGLGLGLTICKGLVDAHGGHITAHSDGIGRGARFVVALPATGEVQRGSLRVAVSLEARAHRALRILVLEDSRDAADAVAMALRLRGHDVRVAHRVHDAVALRDEPFDVLVSDLRLPDGTGLDAMRAFRTAGVRGIALSGFGTTDDVEKSHAAGFAHHLTKPVHLDRLIEAVERTASAPAPAAAERTHE